MAKPSDKDDNNERRPHRVRLPGFLIEEELGLGDLIKRTTSFVGIKTCGRCERRAAVLNRWFRFSGKQI